MKVIPINAASGPGSRKFSQAKNVAKEIQMLKTMDAVHGFTRYRDVYVLEGRMHTAFIEGWRRWKQNPTNDCQMSDPSDPAAYSDKQIWAVIEMDDAGAELEVLRNPSIFQVYDIFWSVTLALAYGEMVAEFEVSSFHPSYCVHPTHGSASIEIFTLATFVIDPKRPADSWTLTPSSHSR